MPNFFLLDFSWTQLLQPQWYIDNGGLWFVLFIVFAETGLFAGFFLPGDALLFVTGIFSEPLITAVFGPTNSQWIDLGLMWIMVSIAGILGNFVGYWFGRKSGPFLYERKDSFFFKKRHLKQAHDFYERNGGGAIVIARFLPFIRTFAPIVAGIVQMDRKKFAFYNVVGCMLWAGSMLIAGHFLQTWIFKQWGFDLKEHLEVIVIGIIAITTAPVIWKIMTHKKKEDDITISK